MTKPTSGKTPYEIRLELLQMAQNQLHAQFELQMKFATQALQLATDAQWKTIDQLKSLMPAAYTMEDIVKKAQELYGFVQKKD